jgi:hypothetical protein
LNRRPFSIFKHAPKKDVVSSRDPFQQEGKAALITGGAKTLGYNMALAFTEAEANVALMGNRAFA